MENYREIYPNQNLIEGKKEKLNQRRLRKLGIGRNTITIIENMTKPRESYECKMKTKSYKSK